MNIEAMIVTVLVFWVFALQRRVSQLEALVESTIVKTRETQRHQEAPVVEETAVLGEVRDTLSAVTVEEKPNEEASHVEMIEAEYGEPAAVSQKKEPSVVMRWLADYFTGGNLLVRIGGVVLFFGLAFLVKYAAEHSMVSIEVRLGAVAAGAVALIFTGWRLRRREGAYGQVLQGLGVAILYLVIYGAAKFYGMLSLESAFVLMLFVVVLGSALALIEDALPLALFASAGGFLVPILTSSGSGSHVVLFSYYVVLNLGIFMIAWYRSWRVLNLLGFGFTFIIATLWGVLRYRSEMFATTEPFLLLFFAMYLAISILFTLKHPYEPKNLVDGTLVFGLPVVAFPLQLALVEPFKYGEAYSAAGLGTIYAFLYILLKTRERTILLAQSFLALSVVFSTIAIPYIFDTDVSAALWSLEGAALVWVSVRQQKRMARYFGVFLLLLSALVYPESVGFGTIRVADYLGFLVVITALVLAAWQLDKYRKVLEPFAHYFVYVFLLFALSLWFRATPSQLDFLGDQTLLFTLVLGTLVCIALAKVLHWRLLAVALQGVLPFGIFLFYATIPGFGRLEALHPFAGYGFWAFVSLMGVVYGMLWAYDHLWRYAKVLHIAALWFGVSVLSLEAHFHIPRYFAAESMTVVSWAVVPLLAAIVTVRFWRYFGKYGSVYRSVGTAGLIALLAVWELAAFGSSPEASGYLPLANPLDAIQLAVLGMIVYWVYTEQKSWPRLLTIQMYGIILLLGWMLLTVLFARYVHLMHGVAYSFNTLWRSGYFQAGISILWSMAAIAAMLLSKRYGQRTLWLAGFGLLLLVVLKLFFVELAHSGTIERIVSFIVVGVLLLLIGYFVPMPPGESAMKDIPEE